MRIIPRLDVKTENVVKGVCFEGLRIVGKPADLVDKYYHQGADEILYIDTVASLYRRKNIKHVLRHAASELHIPLTVGGGISSLGDIEELLNSGADKVAINTYALANPSFISESAREFGSQSIVISINAKMMSATHWVPWTDNAREPTDIDVFDWIKTVLDLGAGEILLTSIDCDGRLQGLDYELIERASNIIDIPFIVGGGFSSDSDIRFLEKLNVDGLSTASFLHQEKGTVSDIRGWAGLCHSAIDSLPPSDTGKLVRHSPNKNKIVGILEYGCGNIYSLCKSLERIGVNFKVVNTPADLAMINSLILPGVGAFGHAMHTLSQRGFLESLQNFADSNRPILGICLGAQLLLDSSEEFGSFKGLGLIPGHVKKIREKSNNCKIPNVGWSKLLPTSNVSEDANLANESFYFTHSYMMSVNEENLMYEIEYCGQTIQALVTDGRYIFGAQFHPEKSSSQGLDFLNWFCFL